MHVGTYIPALWVEGKAECTYTPALWMEGKAECTYTPALWVEGKASEGTRIGATRSLARAEYQPCWQPHP